MKLLLVAGHGAGDPGAVSNGHQEAIETRNVVAGLVKALDGYCDVVTYPTSRNAYADYMAGQLNATAQFAQYDYVLEIHFNASKASQSDGVTKGTEVYVTTAEPGTAVERAMVAAIADVGFANRGVKRYNWAVINRARKAGVSSALLEVCFIDDPDDMALYKAKQSDIVEAIATSIVNGFGLCRPDQEQEVEVVTYEEWKAFAQRYEAEQAAKDPSQWSAEDRKWAEGNGIISGTGKQKDYMSHVTKEEVAAMCHRTYNLATSQGQK